jgi:hypothetical protein
VGGKNQVAVHFANEMLFEKHAKAGSFLGAVFRKFL